MSILNELAIADLMLLLGKAATLAFKAAFDTAFCASMMYTGARVTSWCIGLPRQLTIDWYPYARLLHFNMFVRMEQTKDWFSVTKALLLRDAPADGVAGAEISNAITSTLLLLLYGLVSFLLYNILTVLSYIYAYGLWVIVVFLSSLLMVALALYIHLRPSNTKDSKWNRTIKRCISALLAMPFKIGFFIYTTPFLAMELCRKVWRYLIAIAHPLLEQYYFRRPFRLYKYEAINSDQKEIRLIRMSRRLPGAALKCTFVQIAIEKAPQYEAISYTWGTGEKDRLIFIEDRWLPVTRNVHKILEDRGSYLRTRWLWIDAVCINQDNLEEKSTQVAMMGDIYSGADRVIVWLDNREITHSEVRDANFLLELIAFNSMNLSKDLYDPPTRILGSYTHWKALSRLLSHPYWHRVWIIQEIAMAKKVHILYGSTYLSWEQLSKMITRILLYPVSVIPATACTEYHIKAYSIITGVEQIVNIGVMRNNVHNDNELSLALCLSMTQNCEATDPRDKIFALKNIVERPNKRSTIGTVNVDYKLSLQDVYITSTLKFLTTEPHFVLYLAGIGWERKTNGLPSWVPDFQNFPWVANDTGVQDQAKYGDRVSANFNFEISDVGDLKQFKIQGSVISDICHVSETSITLSEVYGQGDVEDMHLATATLFREAWSIADKLPSKYQATGQPISEVLWRTLIEDRTIIETNKISYKRPAPPEYGLYFQTYQQEFFGAIKRPSSPTKGSRSNSDELMYRSSFALAREFGRVWRGRKLAATTSGLLCIVPPKCELGDLLCIIPGFERPVLMRKRNRGGLQGVNGEDIYHYVGACYAHGITGGEAQTGSSPQSLTII